MHAHTQTNVTAIKTPHSMKLRVLWWLVLSGAALLLQVLPVFRIWASENVSVLEAPGGSGGALVSWSCVCVSLQPSDF